MAEFAPPIIGPGFELKVPFVNGPTLRGPRFYENVGDPRMLLSAPHALRFDTITLEGESHGLPEINPTLALVTKSPRSGDIIDEIKLQPLVGNRTEKCLDFTNGLKKDDLQEFVSSAIDQEKDKLEQEVEQLGEKVKASKKGAIASYLIALSSVIFAAYNGSEIIDHHADELTIYHSGLVAGAALGISAGTVSYIYILAGIKSKAEKLVKVERFGRINKIGMSIKELGIVRRSE